jgi:ATP-binding cassette subfamily F protein 3
MQPHLRAILGAFLFSGDDVEKRVAVLSGGEKARLALAKMLLRPANLLCLDEPTNHLDVTAREILEEALDQYEGTMLFISHDRYFINRIATKVVEVRDHRVWEYAGDYDYYLEKREEEQRAAVSGQRSATEPQRSGSREQGSAKEREPASQKNGRSVKIAETPERPAEPKPRTRDAKRVQAEARQRRGRELQPLKARLKEVEADILRAEARAQTLADLLADPDLYKDGERAREVARERKELGEALAGLYGKWEELAVRLEHAESEAASE